MLHAGLVVKHLKTTANHPQAHRQARRFNRTIVTRLRHHVANDQNNWDSFEQPPTYAYNTQEHRSTNTWPYTLVLSRTTTESLLSRAATKASTTNNTVFSPQLKRKMIQACILALQTKVDSHMRTSQAKHKHDYERRIREMPHFTSNT